MFVFYLRNLFVTVFFLLLLFLLQGIQLMEENEWLRQQVRPIFLQCIEV